MTIGDFINVKMILNQMGSKIKSQMDLILENNGKGSMKGLLKLNVNEEELSINEKNITTIPPSCFNVEGIKLMRKAVQ